MMLLERAGLAGELLTEAEESDWEDWALAKLLLFEDFLDEDVDVPMGLCSTCAEWGQVC